MNTHMILAISPNPSTILPLCGNWPLPLPVGASYTDRPREVTCPKCRERLQKAKTANS